MKQLLIAFALLVTAMSVTADDINPVGTYAYTGTDPDGTAYQGTVTVTKQHDQYGVSYKETSDAGVYTGVGLVGDEEFVVAAVAEGKNSISILTPDKKGGFTAVWAWEGAKGLGKETWTAKK